MEHQTQLCTNDCSSTRTKKSSTPKPPPHDVWWQPAVCPLERERLVRSVFRGTSISSANRGRKRQRGGEWRGCWSEMTQEGNDPAWWLWWCWWCWWYNPYSKSVSWQRRNVYHSIQTECLVQKYKTGQIYMEFCPILFCIAGQYINIYLSCFQFKSNTHP